MKKLIILLLLSLIFSFCYSQESLKQDDAFCSTVKKIIKESYQDFTNSKGPQISEEGEVIKTWKYQTNFILQDADECFIQLFMGSLSYRAIFGPFEQKSSAIAMSDRIMDKLNDCLGSSIYYQKNTKDDGLLDYEIGFKEKNYFTSTLMYLSIYKDDVDNDKYVVFLSIYKPSAEKIFILPFSSGSNDETFDNNLKKQISNSYNDFENIRGEKHVEEDMWESKTYYDIDAKLPGSESCIYDESAFIYKPCESLFYRGDSKSTAIQIYEELENKIKKALGSKYVYRVDEIYENDPKGKMVFAKKDELSDDTALIILEAKEISSTYYVNIQVIFEYFLSIGL